MTPKTAKDSESEVRSPASVFFWRHLACLADHSFRHWGRQMAAGKNLRNQRRIYTIALRITRMSIHDCITQLLAAFLDHKIDDPRQGDECNRTKEPFGENVPGDRLILEFTVENLVAEKERVNAHNQDDNGRGGSKWTY
jgi:hypothetical protein